MPRSEGKRHAANVRLLLMGSGFTFKEIRESTKNGFEQIRMPLAPNWEYPIEQRANLEVGDA